MLLDVFVWVWCSSVPNAHSHLLSKFLCFLSQTPTEMNTISNHVRLLSLQLMTIWFGVALAYSLDNRPYCFCIRHTPMNWNEILCERRQCNSREIKLSTAHSTAQHWHIDKDVRHCRQASPYWCVAIYSRKRRFKFGAVEILENSVQKCMTWRWCWCTQYSCSTQWNNSVI